MTIRSFSSSAAPPSAGLNDLKPFNLSTVLMAVHKDCHTSLDLTQQGGLRRRETENAPGGRIIRTIGAVRARAKIGLQNLVYNVRRLVILERTAIA